jgi:hypothetical protein
MYCLFCAVLCIVCVYMCTVLLPPSGYPVAVKYIISYHGYTNALQCSVICTLPILICMLLLELRDPIAFLTKLTVGHSVTCFHGFYVAGRFITDFLTTRRPNKQTNKCNLRSSSVYSSLLSSCGGTRWRSWLRHCATSRKVASSIPDGVIGIFHWHNPSGRTMAVGLIQPLTGMSTKNISWG